MQEIRQLNEEYNSGVKVMSLISKKVRDSNGKDVGYITEVRLNPKTLDFDGIEMDRGLFGKYTFIGRKYITALSEDGAVLNMSITTDIKGMKVADSTGREVGVVKDVQTEGASNDMFAIVVGSGLFKNDMVFPKSDIMGVGESVVLNVRINSKGARVGRHAK